MKIQLFVASTSFYAFLSRQPLNYLYRYIFFLTLKTQLKPLLSNKQCTQNEPGKFTFSQQQTRGCFIRVVWLGRPFLAFRAPRQFQFGRCKILRITFGKVSSKRVVFFDPLLVLRILGYCDISRVLCIFGRGDSGFCYLQYCVQSLFLIVAYWLKKGYENFIVFVILYDWSDGNTIISCFNYLQIMFVETPVGG